MPATSSQARRPAVRLAAVVIASVLLVWPGFWNGYPLIFADTGTYIGHSLLIHLGWDRPPFYSLFLFATH